MANIIDLSQFRDNAEQPETNIISLQGFAKTPSLSETYAHDSVADKAAFAARLGAADTYRGIKQLFNIQEEEMAEDMAKLNEYISNPEYGGTILAAYTAGLVGDPVGWVIPGMKAKNLWSAAKAGAMVGALSSPLGYVDEAEGQTRLSNIAYGTAGGAVLSPAMFKFTNTLLPAMKKGYSDFGVSIDTGKVAKDLGFISRGVSTVGANVLAPGYAQVKKGGNLIKESALGQSFGKYFIDNFGLPKQYVDVKMNRRQTEQQWASRFDEVLGKYSQLSLADDKLLYKILTGEESNIPGNLKDLTKEGRELVDEIGQELVDLKILDEKIFNENKGKYLYRSYEKHQTPFMKKRRNAEKEIKVFGEEFMRRGETKTIAKNALDKHLKDGWKVIDGGSAQNKTVRVNRDWSPEDRAKMGEILSAGFAMAKTGNLMTNDIATFKFYDDINKMVIDGEKIALDSIDDVIDPAKWKRIPNTNVKNTRVKEFGSLANKWVPKEVYTDLTTANAYKRWNRGDGTFGGLGKFHHKALQFWKRSKTTLNPTVHTNNVGSNFILYDILNGDWKQLRSAGKDFLKAKRGEKSEEFKLAESLGVFDADMMSRELTDYENSIFKKYMSMKNQDDVQFSSRLQRGWDKVKEFAKNTPMDKLYQVEDQVFRLGAFKTQLANGATPDEAARFARRSMLDYDISAPGIRMLRESALPFIAYTYRVAPILAETALKRPWKLAKWGAILHGANMVGQDISPGDYEKERKYQKELNMGYDLSSIGMPGVANTLIKVPRKDKSQYLDATRFIPGGDILDIQNHTGITVPFLPAPLQPSFGAIGSAAKIVTGFDTFSASRMPGVGSGVFDISAEARKNAIFKEFVPMYHQGKRLADTLKAQGVPHPTKDDSTLTEAVLNVIPGIKLKTYDKTQMKKLKMRVGMKYQNRMESLTKVLSQSYKDYKGGRLSKEEYNKQQARIKRELKKLQEEARKGLK